MSSEKHKTCIKQNNKNAVTKIVKLFTKLALSKTSGI